MRSGHRTWLSDLSIAGPAWSRQLPLYRARPAFRPAGLPGLNCGRHQRRIGWGAMRIGIDFDNTLIDYDRVFLEAARERGLVGADFIGTKRAVRDAIRLLPDGETAWQRLQGYVYGAGIAGAVPYPGALDFLRRGLREGATMFVVSHKTRFGHFDPAQVDLREAARDWLGAQGFLAAVPADRLYFEDDRACKIARIAELGCNHFIDDLEEVFADPSFPAGVRRILLSDSASDCCDVQCGSWREITAAVFGDAG